MKHRIACAAVAVAIGLVSVFAVQVPAGHAQHAPCNPAVQVC